MVKKSQSKKTKTKPGSAGAADSEPSAPSSTRSASTWLFVAFALIGVLTFVLVLLGTDPPPAAEPRVRVVNPADTWEQTPLQPVSSVPERDYARGPADAAVSIVAFSDFECPYCRDASAEFEIVRERFPDEVRLVFRNYPLDTSCNENVTRTSHFHSCKAAVMARCAGEQGRFWDMHDAIFDLPRLSVSALDALPAELGLSEPAFEACVASDEVMDDLRADIDEGRSLGVTGTPAVFVNRRKMSSFRASTLSAIVEHVLSADDDD